MRQVDYVELVHVVSEPGDLTRYDYIVFRDGPDEFTFMPARSTFKFPQRINKWDDAVTEEDEAKRRDAIEKIAREYGCNPFTVIECISSIKHMEANTDE